MGSVAMETAGPRESVWSPRYICTLATGIGVLGGGGIFGDGEKHPAGFVRLARGGGNRIEHSAGAKKAFSRNRSARGAVGGELERVFIRGVIVVEAEIDAGNAGAELAIVGAAGDGEAEG